MIAEVYADNGRLPAEANAEFIVRAVNNHGDLLEALENIAKAEGPYSRDSLTHAENVIEAMVKLATAAIRQANGGTDED